VKIVLDTTVLIRGHNRSRALARRLLRDILEGGHRLILSNEIITEAVKVLRYPRFQDLYGLTDADLLDYSQFLQNVADIVVLDPRYRAPLLRDPKDTHVLQTAELGEADILCTHDSDFIEDEALLAFCAARGIAVCTERVLLMKLAGA
jgi:putative PIN family toxin of toxin-antitoxin system